MASQLRSTDAEGHRFTAFLTDTTRGQLADLELRRRQHASVEDRVRRGGQRAPTWLGRSATCLPKPAAHRPSPWPT